MLARAWAAWKRAARVVATVQAHVLLTLFYFVIVPPFALVVRLSRDPLGLAEPKGGSYWLPRSPSEPGPTGGRRQF